MVATWFTESVEKLLLAAIRLCDKRYSSQYQDQGPVSTKDDGFLLDLTHKARARPKSGAHGSDNGGNADAGSRSKCYSSTFGSKEEELYTCIPPERPISAPLRPDATKKSFDENNIFQKKFIEIHSSWIDHINGNPMVTTDLSWTPLQMVNIELGGKPSEETKSVGGFPRFKNQNSAKSWVLTPLTPINHLVEAWRIDFQFKCVKIVKDNKAIVIDPHLKLDQSRTLLSTATNGNFMTRSWVSWPYYLTEPYEEYQIICNEAAISCEAELLSDPHEQIRKGPLTEEEGILEAIARIEDEWSHDARTYSHVGDFKLYSRFDQDDKTSFIQASHNAYAVLPDEAPSTPLLEVPSSKKKYVFVWTCCSCGVSRINIMVNECPECSTPRCGYCNTEKVQVR